MVKKQNSQPQRGENSQPKHLGREKTETNQPNRLISIKLVINNKPPCRLRPLVTTVKEDKSNKIQVRKRNSSIK